MPTGLEIIAVAAALTLLGSFAAARAICGKTDPVDDGLSVLHTQMRQRAIKLRQMLPAQIAERVVGSIRTHASNIYAITPDDLDDYIKRWCADNHIEQPALGIVRELMLDVPGVRRKRIWLNAHSREHAYIRQRQAYRNRPNERPTLYWIDDRPDIPQSSDRTVSTPCPSAVRSARTVGRTSVRQRPVASPVERRAAA